MSKEFTPAPKYLNFTFWSQTNNGTIGGVSETSWEIIDSQNNPIYTWNNLPPNTQFKDTINLSDGCYTFKVTDIDNDGLDFWGNNDGGGMLRFKDFNPSLTPRRHLGHIITGLKLLSLILDRLFIMSF